MPSDVGISTPPLTSAEEENLATTPKDAEVLSKYPPFQRSLELVSIGAFTALSIVVAARLWLTSQGADLWLIAAAAFAGYLCSDLVSGVVHWGFDSWGSIHTPILGKNFIRPFREHHFDEKAMTKHDFVETNGNNCLVSVPVLLVAAFLPLDAAHEWRLAACAMALFTCFGVFLTNQTHKWAHLDEPPRLVSLLQRWHLILTPENHAVHHQPPHDTYYCITTGWLNATLHRLRFFSVLEVIVHAITGAVPRRDDLS